jgi:hypothetical protein
VAEIADAVADTRANEILMDYSLGEQGGKEALANMEWVVQKAFRLGVPAADRSDQKAGKVIAAALNLLDEMVEKVRARAGKLR